MIKYDVDERNPSKTLNKFKKKIRESRIILEMQERQTFKTNSQKRKEKKAKSEHRRLKAEQAKNI